MITLTFSRTKKHGGEIISRLSFKNASEARLFVEAVARDRPRRWSGPDRLTIWEWVEVSGDELESLMGDKKSSHKEVLSDAGLADVRKIRRFHIGSHPDIDRRSRSERGLKPLSDAERADYLGEN